MPITAWSVVPSTKKSQRHGKPHPLHALVSGIMGDIPEIRLESQSAKKRGSLGADFFTLQDEDPVGLTQGHIFLIDDSWTTGGTVQSAAVRLKLSGARQVSIYCVARIADLRFLRNINPEYEKEFQRSMHYVVGYCPWRRTTE